MTGDDGDSSIIRPNQDKDTPQHIVEDETHARPEQRDSDPASGAAREAAKRSDAQQANEQMNAIFQGNQRAVEADAAESKFEADAAPGGNLSLVNPGRSLLGN